MQNNNQVENQENNNKVNSTDQINESENRNTTSNDFQVNDNINSSIYDRTNKNSKKSLIKGALVGALVGGIAVGGLAILFVTGLTVLSTTGMLILGGGVLGLSSIAGLAVGASHSKSSSQQNNFPSNTNVIDSKVTQNSPFVMIEPLQEKMNSSVLNTDKNGKFVSRENNRRSSTQARMNQL